ncbi:putative Cell division protein FtsX [uncultured Desulfobacterium sp.]|uniref:Cell division protein FtsX n=1 Tax=uncultured Desulfobacterium sp. TaxID=201089 RepID=A0A445MZY2_9BACT|nr:putative Cell division protein FtsX [uncultured Desulfobacterium sp.]
MKSRLWAYLLKQALLNITDNRMLHLISIGTMVVSLSIFGSFLFLFVNINTWIQGWGHKVSISVYIKDGVDEATKNKISSALRSFPNAEIRRFISKEDALKDLKNALGSESGLLDSLSRNPLPASFEMVFDQIEPNQSDPEKIKEEIEKIDGVDEVQYSGEWLKQFEDLMDMVRIAGFIIGGLLCLGVIFIVSNTIRLTIYSRRQEIEIKKLVGATDWFVKTPFLLEGIFQGLFSGAISVLILFSGYLLICTNKLKLLGIVGLDLVFLPYDYLLLLFVISIALGLTGSFIAVSRFISSDHLFTI